MEFEDFAQPEVGVAVAVTAIAASPSIRKTLRKGAAYTLAGVLLAGDAAHRLVNSIAKGARHAAADSGPIAGETEPHAEEVVATGAESA